MEMQTRHIGDVFVIVPRGSFCGTEPADMILSQARQALRAGHRRLLIEFSHVTLVDPCVLNALFVAHSECAAAGCRLKLFGLARSVCSRFPWPGMNPLEGDIHETEREAMASFEGRSESS